MLAAKGAKNVVLGLFGQVSYFLGRNFLGRVFGQSPAVRREAKSQGFRRRSGTPDFRRR